MQHAALARRWAELLPPGALPCPPADEMSVGSKNERRLCVAYCGKDSGFEAIHGILNRAMEVLSVGIKGKSAPCRPAHVFVEK